MASSSSISMPSNLYPCSYYPSLNHSFTTFCNLSGHRYIICQPRNNLLLAFVGNTGGISKRRQHLRHLLCSFKKQAQPQQPPSSFNSIYLEEEEEEEGEGGGGGGGGVLYGAVTSKRREALLNMAFTGLTLAGIVSNNNDKNAAALAEQEDFRVYTDDVNKFQISIPQRWLVGTGEPNGFKSVTAFYPEEASGSNVSVVITGLSPDFTRMESFGKVEAFAETLVGGLDRSWQRPPGVAAKLLDCKASNGFYYIEYTLQNPGESMKHLYSALGMAFNGWYNRLYTVTGQFVDEDSEKYASKIKKAVSSFRFL